MLTSAESFHCIGSWVLGRTKHKAVQCCLLQVNKRKGILVWHMEEKLDLRKRKKKKRIFLKIVFCLGFFLKNKRWPVFFYLRFYYSLFQKTIIPAVLLEIFLCHLEIFPFNKYNTCIHVIVSLENCCPANSGSVD